MIQLNSEFGYRRGLATRAPEQLGQHPVRKPALHREASGRRRRQRHFGGGMTSVLVPMVLLTTGEESGLRSWVGVCALRL